jgi:hypothetical protein
VPKNILLLSSAVADTRTPLSLDRDVSDRTLDRQLAYLGLLDDAAPLFSEGSSVPGVGVLLALPCLVESGLFQISRKLYGEIGPAFYGLRTTLLTLLLMALLRIKCCFCNTEAMRCHSRRARAAILPVDNREKEIG